MNRTDVAYLINTTPKYFYLIQPHLILLKRYAPHCKWPIFIATEEPQHAAITAAKKAFPDITIIPLTQANEAFLESRLAGTRALPPHIEYLLPMQEDFLLEGRPIDSHIKEALEILDDSPSVSSVRLMPCPGPKGDKSFGYTKLRILEYDEDPLVFTYQATLWRRESYDAFMSKLIEQVGRTYGTRLTPKQKAEIHIKINVAETEMGHNILKQVTQLHLSYLREGSQPNAVYLASWPYRPTAVVHGILQTWAMDLGSREGISLNVAKHSD